MAEFHPLRDLETKTSQSWKTLDKKAEERAKKAECAAMPSLDHLSMNDFEEVYEPSDDTYLLLDGLLSELQAGIFGQLSSPVVLEIGCGTGVSSVFIGNQLREGKGNKNTAEPLIFVTDINPVALQVTKATANANRSSASCHSIVLEAIQCDLMSVLLSRLHASVDVLLFNPPYVPTPDNEVAGDGIEASWAGGKKGRRVIDRAIPQIAQILSKPDGLAYMITVDDNEPEQLAKAFWDLGLDMKPLVRRRACNEFLTVQKICWIQENTSSSMP